MMSFLQLAPVGEHEQGDPEGMMWGGVTALERGVLIPAGCLFLRSLINLFTWGCTKLCLVAESRLLFGPW